jgi:hypothetical protein
VKVKRSWAAGWRVHRPANPAHPISRDFFLNNTLFNINSRNNIRFQLISEIIHRPGGGTRIYKIGFEEPETRRICRVRPNSGCSSPKRGCRPPKARVGLSPGQGQTVSGRGIPMRQFRVGRPRVARFGRTDPEVRQIKFARSAARPSSSSSSLLLSVSLSLALSPAPFFLVCERFIQPFVVVSPPNAVELADL